MKNSHIEPVETESWQNLSEVLKSERYHRSITIHQFKNCKVGGVSFDFSRNSVSEKTLENLYALAKECRFEEYRESYFKGGLLNMTEKREVLHTALRNSQLQDHQKKEEIGAVKEKMYQMCNAVISGRWKGYTGKAINTVINIGIGGSDLGPKMVVEALAHYRNHLNVHYLSNIDSDATDDLLKDIDFETTLVVVVSKSFTTTETLSNFEYVLERSGWDKVAIQRHVLAVTANVEKATGIGIDQDNILPMWDWVGGRFSLWSAVGISIALAIGTNNFKELLHGAEMMDQHFYNTALPENVPAIGALLGIWYSSFMGYQSEAIVPYYTKLQYLPPFLQQLCMESNGKSVDRNGKKIDYPTGTVVFGGVGTNAQHAFMQLLHQGPTPIPVDFIGVKDCHSEHKEHHKILMANLHGQMEALWKGRKAEELADDVDKELIPYKVFTGSRPCNAIIMDKMTPENLGILISYYEHKVFTQGIIWNINSFDQFGVELGKELAQKYH